MNAITLAVLFAILPTCSAEDSMTPCAWDATVQGNGEGRSFVVMDGDVYPMPDCVAGGWGVQVPHI